MTTVGCTFLQTQFSEWRSQSNIFDSQQPRDNGWTRWSGLYWNTSRPCPGTKTGGYIPQCPRPAVARIDTTHSLGLQLRAEILQGPVSVLGAEPDCQPVLAIEADLAGASVNSSLRCLLWHLYFNNFVLAVVVEPPDPPGRFFFLQFLY